MALAPGDPWEGYKRLVVTIVRPLPGTIVVRSAPADQVGLWPWDAPEPVYVLTAWNPGVERPGEALNRARQAALDRELRRLAPDLWRAVGHDPLTGERDEGVAVRGMSEPDVLSVAALYRQDAIFCWSPTEWAIAARDGKRRLSLGWQARVGAPSA